VPRPFRQAVCHVHDALAVEDVTRRPERFGQLANLSEIEQGRKREPHAAAFVSDGRAAARTAHLARRRPLRAVEGVGIEAKMFDPPSQTDMTFVEDRSPLHGRAVQRLAGPAVADLGSF